jgi:hypothetical protein
LVACDVIAAMLDDMTNTIFVVVQHGHQAFLFINLGMLEN